MAAPLLVTREGPRLAADCPRPLKPVRVAVVGLGRAGIAHATLLASIPDCELVAVMDRRAEARVRARGLGHHACTRGLGSCSRTRSPTRCSCAAPSTSAPPWRAASSKPAPRRSSSIPSA